MAGCRVRDQEVQRLVEYVRSKDNTSTPHLPILIFPDGSYLSEPTNSQIADKIGLKTHPQMPFYDMIIVGAGPAGLAELSTEHQKDCTHC